MTRPDTSTEMSAGVKGVLAAVVAYIATIGMAVFIAVTAIVILMIGSPSCSDMGQALLVLWGTIAAVFLASTAVLGVVVCKIVAGTTGRLAIVVTYGVVLLVSYAVIAFGLMVAFNC